MKITGDVPDSELTRNARDFATQTYDSKLLAHCDRTYLFGKAIAEHHGVTFDSEIAYVAALLHDLGLQSNSPGDNRFEVEGANAARAWAQDQRLSSEDTERTWDAIVLHTSVGIAPAKSAEASVVHWGAGADAVGFCHDCISAKQASKILKTHPRSGFSSHLEHLLVAAVARAPEAYFQTAFAELAVAHGIEVPTVEGLMSKSHFRQSDL